ncbi:hypothetical protein BH23ACT3_BH23ACT3_22060 [soil metagenome]
MALTIGLTATAVDRASAVAAFDRVWWVLLVGGLLTTLCALPLRTGPGAVVTPAPVGVTTVTAVTTVTTVPAVAPSAGD